MSKQQKTRLGRARRNFFTGLAVVLPVIISIGVALWLFEPGWSLFPTSCCIHSHTFPGIELSDSLEGMGKPGSDLVLGWKVVAILEAVSCSPACSVF